MPWVRKRAARGGEVHFTAYYRDPTGRTRSAGTFASQRDARAAGWRAESSVESGSWFDRTAGKATFREYVEETWWPSRHLELSTKQSYRSYLDKHFLPYFGDQPMAKILPSTVQGWVTQVAADGLSARSVMKYHVMLHSIFKRAVRDRIIAFNPCTDIELPKVVTRKMPTLTPEEFDRLLEVVPERWTPLVLTAIETGLRWGELIALRPRHIDFLRRTVSVQETIVEVSKKISPTGERMIVKPYPKDDEPRTLGVSQDLLDVLAARIQHLGLGRDDLLFPSIETAGGNPVSRNTFRTRVWLPALEKAQLAHHVRMHDLRHAHASWLLVGGADLKTVMDRMGHRQIQTTQKYLHTLPGADDRAMNAFQLTRQRHREGV
ncbi:tyrosine-type recombinase/integrase [Sporichthya sp.]|uniref:tyrosine-type recombinase/integrase n=1 Tax=Sporichthya sp. TaxID=65475 RepID=UPI0017CEA16C|nr:tyrosine-type recombinase/integrase [Sporichthya sp.]MBA3741982.1 tyrosine-type recombinase/integrase [Sporichthya sp.]